MIRPKRWSTIYFWVARVMRNAPRRCTPMTVSQSLSVILNSMLSRITPALLTSTPGGPSSATTLSTPAATWSGWLTSAPTAMARPPAAVIASTVPPASASFRSSTATAIPSAARRREIAAPMPRAPPVTIAIRCSSDMRSSRRSLLVLLQLAPGQRALVHLVRAVGEPQRPGAGPQVGQREVLADPGRAVHLDRLVDHPFGHGRSRDLDGLDLRVRALVADRVHQPGGLEHQQAGRLDPDPGLGDPVLDDALTGQGAAERVALRGPAAHQLQRPLGRADLPHAVVDAAGAEPGLGDRESITLARDQVGGRYPDVPELHLRVPAVRAVGEAEHVDPALDRNPGGIPRHQDHRLLAVPLGGRLGLAHHDQDRAAGVHRPRRPPLAAVDHVLVPVTLDPGRDVGGIRGGHVGLGHAERRPDLPVEQRPQPAPLLLGAAELGEQFHVAGVRRCAVQCLRG